MLTPAPLDSNRTRLARPAQPLNLARLVKMSLLIGLALLMIGGYLILLLQGGPKMRLNWGVDFGDYWLAGARVLHGQSPYAPAMLAGPFDAGGLDRFRYPPPFALVVSPLSLLSLETAKLVWAALSLAALYLGCELAARAGRSDLGRRAKPFERILQMTVIFGFFPPVFDSILKGNVEGFEVLGLGAALGASSTLAIGSVLLLGLLKIGPILTWPAALLRSKANFWRASALILLSLVLSLPWLTRGWLDFPVVLFNQLAGSSDFPANQAPTQFIQALVPGNLLLTSIVRALTLLTSAALFLISIWHARRPAGWPAALLAALIASLLLPGVIWEHYLTLLLPFFFFVWPNAGRQARVWLAISLCLIPLAILDFSGGMLLAAPLIGMMMILLGRRTQAVYATGGQELSQLAQVQSGRESAE